MSSGECSVIADASFTNLMVDTGRIADICSNIGIATVVRVRPELADHEHLYYEKLHEGGNKEFDAAFDKAHDLYFTQLKGLENAAKA